MRRWVTAAAIGGVTVLGLAGCGLPEGIDGAVTDDWGGFAEPVGFVPDAEMCHESGYEPIGTLDAYDPVECTRSHLAETVHVGTFTGDAADRVSPPRVGSPDMRAAYQECDTAATEYLGADFRRARLWLGVITPSSQAWDGGARWFRCDLAELAQVFGAEVTRTGSLRGALEGSSDLRLGCFTVKLDADDEIEEMNPVGCDEPHRAEFVGVWTAPEVPYLDAADEDAADQVHRGCRKKVAAYADVPADGDLIYRTGTVADWLSEEAWDAGDRGFRCYLWLDDRNLTESVKDGGTEALPIQYE